MSEPQAEREIMDVLSSIRRLVSEDRRAKPAPLAERVEPSVSAPPELAHAEEGGTQSLTAESAGSRLPVESRFVLTAALRIDTETEAHEAELEPDQSTDDSSGGASDAPPVSLEATIAELEAAVAGIEADFEPDGGDHAPDEMADKPALAWIAPQAPIREVEEYHGIIAGFDGRTLADDRLDLPIGGDATIALPRHSADWRSAPTADTGKEPAGYIAASFHHKPAAPRLDMVPELSAEAVTAPEQDEQPVNQMEPAEETTRDASDAAPDAPVDEAEPRHDAGECGDKNSGGESLLGASRPTIFRSAREDDDGSALGDPTPITDTLASDQDDAADDLFDPLAGSDLDMAALRDIVAEIVRDELRGTLGERITRNLRALVRREIARALEAEGLTRE